MPRRGRRHRLDIERRHAPAASGPAPGGRGRSRPAGRRAHARRSPSRSASGRWRLRRRRTGTGGRGRRRRAACGETSGSDGPAPRPAGGRCSALRRARGAARAAELEREVVGRRARVRALRPRSQRAEHGRRLWPAAIAAMAAQSSRPTSSSASVPPAAPRAACAQAPTAGDGADRVAAAAIKTDFIACSLARSRSADAARRVGRSRSDRAGRPLTATRRLCGIPERGSGPGRLRLAEAPDWRFGVLMSRLAHMAPWRRFRLQTRLY